MEGYKIAGIVAGLVVVYVVGYFLVKDSSNKFFNRARALHKEAELCYQSGDFDLADEYYTKAEEMRKKGWEQA